MKNLLNINKKDKHDWRINMDEISSLAIKRMVWNLEQTNQTNNNNETWISESVNLKPLIEVRNLEKSYKKNNVLKNISFNINEGENVAILGSNGAGKTTLVEILAGLNKKDKGELKFNFDYKNTYLEKVGIQFQDSSYPPGISVKNVVDFMIDVYQIKINNSELNALFKIFAIDKFYKKRASSLSGGQQQRLNALLAIIHNPRIIFLDELSTGLDISIRTKIKEFIKEFAIENNSTLVLVSHDLGEIEYLAKRIIFLKDGKIVVNELTENIIQKYYSLENFLAQYI